MAALGIEPRSHRIGSGELMAGKYLGWAAFAISIGGILSASADPLADAVRADLPSLVALYEDLHRHHDPPFQEKRTAARLNGQPAAQLGLGVKRMIDDWLFRRCLATAQVPTIHGTRAAGERQR